MTLDYQTYFKTFADVSSAIHSGRDTGEILKQIVSHITEIMTAKGCIYWIVNREKETIETMISHGFEYRSLALTDYPTLTTIFDIRNNRETFIENAREDSRIPDLERLGKQRVGAVQGLFFDIQGPYTGILAVYFPGMRHIAAPEKELLQALGQQGAIALERALLDNKRQLRLFRQVVEGMALALEAKDETTHGHSLKVAELARRTARAMGLSSREAETIYHAGLLHDIGKIGVRDKELDRLGKLSNLEMRRVRRHPALGARILAPLPLLETVATLILQHHELYDGTGYPSGLKGDEIALGARILTVCDAFETMISGRAFMRRMTVPEALSALEQGTGTRFDPDVVQAFLNAVDAHPEMVQAPGAFRSHLERIRKKLAAASLEGRRPDSSPSFPIGF